MLLLLDSHIDVSRSGSLQGWPKKQNIAASWTLHGASATPRSDPSLRVKAVSIVAGVPELVARKILLQANVAPVQDTAIKTSQVFEEVRAVDLSLPEDALEGQVTTQKLPEQVTWNAHVRVRK